MPTLVIQGDLDFAVSPDGARRWAELIPDARLIMLSGAGHLAYVERSDRVLPALERFFHGNWPPEAMQLKNVALTVRGIFEALFHDALRTVRAAYGWPQ